MLTGSSCSRSRKFMKTGVEKNSFGSTTVLS
jgi:hypothetical protein